MEENNNDPNKRRKSLSEAQIESGFGGKEAREQLKTMKELIAATKEATKASKDESDKIDDQSFFDNLEKGFSFQGKGIEALRAEFVSLREISQDPNISDAERDIANDTLEALREGIQTEEERREKVKQEEEANSILNQIAESSDRMADGLSDFLGNAFAAGGLLATALFLTDPELFFKLLQQTIQGISEIVESINLALDGDIKKAFENIKENLSVVGPILAVIGAVILPPIIRAVGSVARLFKSIGDGIKALVQGGTRGPIQRIRTVINFIGGALAKLLLPLTAIVIGLKNMFTVATDDSTSALDKVRNFFSGFFGDMVQFLIIDPLKFLLSSIFRIFGRDDAADSVENFFDNFTQAFRDMLDRVMGFLFSSSDFQFGSISETLSSLVAAPFNLIKNMIAGLLGMLGLDNAAESLSSFSFTDIFKFIGETIFGVIDGIVDFFADLISGEGLGNALGNLVSRVGNFMGDMVKAVLRIVLPDPSVDQGIIGNLAVEGLKKLGAYEFAEIDTATGERIQPPEQPPLDADVLAQTQDNITEGQAAAGGGDSAAVLISQPNNTSTSSSVSNVSITNDSTSMDSVTSGAAAMGRA